MRGLHSGGPAEVPVSCTTFGYDIHPQTIDSATRKGLTMKRKITLFIAAAALSGAVLVYAALGAASSASSPRASK